MTKMSGNFSATVLLLLLFVSLFLWDVLLMLEKPLQSAENKLIPYDVRVYTSTRSERANDNSSLSMLLDGGREEQKLMRKLNTRLPAFLHTL